ncbi:Uncharacterized protein TCAP_05161 [Tolypocladium capitatum]|uniref:SET domain-containing protein n=1 Tax=Tolypocladium capitatum TaxID=45235 RepID=A0A2K3QBN0_9HYPO|nr:Uncharacterized protein TCAP_05161 [Tolypocladium capitatum]
MSLSLPVDALLHPFSYPNGQVYDVSVEFIWMAAQVAADERKKELALCTTQVTPSPRKDPNTTEPATDDPPLNYNDRMLLEFIAKLQLQLLGPISEGHATEPSDDDRPSTNAISSTDSEQPQSKPLRSISNDGENKAEDKRGNGGTKLGGDSQEDIIERHLTPIVYKTSPGPKFENRYFEIAESNIAGWGAFAIKDLKRGDTILREKPLFMADHSCLFQEYDKLDKQAKRVALSLYANELFKSGLPRIQGVFETNCFSVGGRLAGLFPIAARFNHACHPTQNVDFEYDEASWCLVLSVRADEIPAGEELKISYGKDRTLAELYMTYGFRCRCGGCPGMSDKDFSKLTSRW